MAVSFISARGGKQEYTEKTTELPHVAYKLDQIINKYKKNKKQKKLTTAADPQMDIYTIFFL